MTGYGIPLGGELFWRARKKSARMSDSPAGLHPEIAGFKRAIATQLVRAPGPDNASSFQNLVPRRDPRQRLNILIDD
jgi:hypothetical protein